MCGGVLEASRAPQVGRNMLVCEHRPKAQLVEFAIALTLNSSCQSLKRVQMKPPRKTLT